MGGSAVLNGRMWLLGGGSYPTVEAPEPFLLNDCWSSADGVEWVCHTRSAPWSARCYHDVCVWDSKVHEIPYIHRYHPVYAKCHSIRIYAYITCTHARTS